MADAAMTSPARVAGNRPGRVTLTRLLNRPPRTTRQRLDDALTQIGAGAIAVAALRIGDALHPLLIHLIHALGSIL